MKFEPQTSNELRVSQ